MNARARKIGTAAVATLGAATLALAYLPASNAHPSGGNRVTTVMTPLNGSTAAGTAWVKLRGNKIDVHLTAQGLVPGMPHAIHIHHGMNAAHECPTMARDANNDGRLSTVEGVPSYGPVAISLTTSGDTSPESVLAVDRYDNAPQGAIGYHRLRIPASPALVKALRNGHGVIVIHGVDYNGNGVYDGEAGQSELNAALPREATDPAACGVLKLRR
jgi:hypothetical protein